jgi:hypothetical protein
MKLVMEHAALLSTRAPWLFRAFLISELETSFMEAVVRVCVCSVRLVFGGCLSQRETPQGSRKRALTSSKGERRIKRQQMQLVARRGSNIFYLWEESCTVGRKQQQRIIPPPASHKHHYKLDWHRLYDHIQ